MAECDIWEGKDYSTLFVSSVSTQPASKIMVALAKISEHLLASRPARTGFWKPYPLLFLAVPPTSGLISQDSIWILSVFPLNCDSLFILPCFLIRPSPGSGYLILHFCCVTMSTLTCPVWIFLSLVWPGLSVQ